VAGGATAGVSVTVSLGSGLCAGASLAATAQLSYDRGQVPESARSVWTVDGPPRPGWSRNHRSRNRRRPGLRRCPGWRPCSPRLLIVLVIARAWPPPSPASPAAA